MSGGVGRRMSGGGVGGGGGKGSGGAAAIPAGARKTVQSIKEIVNYPESEIYAMLKECNMDPSEAVHRLLSQDTFHEVKSKREKKKETKETPELRSRSVSTTSNRGFKGSSERSGRTSVQPSSYDDGGSGAKTFPKKESIENFAVTPNLGLSAASSYSSRRPAVQNDSSYMENNSQASFVTDASLCQQPSTGSQNNWFAVPGRRSMADVVKMGRPQGKPANFPIVINDASFPSPNVITQTMSHHNVNLQSENLPLDSSHGLHSENLPLDSSQELHSFQNADSLDQSSLLGHQNSQDYWPHDDESPAVNVPNVTEIPYTETSSLHVDASSLHDNHRFDEMHSVDDDVGIEHPPTEPVRSISVNERQGFVDSSGDDFVDESITDAPYNSHGHTFEHQDQNVDEDISSVAANYQQLSLHEGSGTLPSVEIPSVIIPDHLQVTNADCSHLSFGSFSSGINAALPGSLSSKHMKTNLDVNAANVVDGPSVDQSDARNSEYHDNGQLRSLPIKNLASAPSISTRDFDIPSTSQSDDIRNDVLDGSHGLQYNIPSVSGYTLPSTTLPDASYSFPQDLASFSSLMQHYSSSLPSNALASSLQPNRNFDHSFSPLLTTQSVPTKHGTSMSSLSGPTTSMAEAVKQGVFSNHQPSTHGLTSSGVPTGPTLQQHMAVHPYSQPTLPLSPFTNMISYPVLHQSYAYMPPSAFQQTYAGNGAAFHQSPPSIHNPGIKYTLPQYKNIIPVTSLTQQSSVTSGYGGGFGGSTGIPGNLSLNPSTGSASTTIGFNEALSSQYNDAGHHVPQQSENLAMWIHGGGSPAAMSAVQPNTFYSFMGQSQLGGYRQGQQPTHFGSPSYPNLYHSAAAGAAAGVSQEQQHQQSAAGEAGPNNPQAPAQQQHQLWQHSY